MKKFLGSLMAIAILVSFPVTAMAEKTISETEQIEPRAYLCDSCGRGYLFSHQEFGHWWTSSYYSCKHDFPSGEDRLQKRDVFTVWECGSCDFTDKVKERNPDPELAERIVCYGRDEWSLHSKE